MSELVDFARARPDRTEIAVSWLRHDLDDAHAARRRWPFVGLAAGALSARTIVLTARADDCESDLLVEGATYWRCTIDTDRYGERREALVLRDPGALDVGTWLDGTEGSRATFAIQTSGLLQGVAAPPRYDVPELWRWWSAERPGFWGLGLVVGVLLVRWRRRWAGRWFDLAQPTTGSASRTGYRTPPEAAAVETKSGNVRMAIDRLVAVVLVVVVVFGPTALWLAAVAMCRAR